MSTTERLKRRAQENVESIKDKIIEIAKYLYENPEIAYEEYKACELLTYELKQSGFEVTKGIAGLPTAFKAVLRGRIDGPKVAILAEYDALPGLGHGCGHNLSAASAIGAAIALARLMSELNGTLLIFGTPAEEGSVRNSGGKVAMINEFKGLDAAMMMHAMDMNAMIINSSNRETLEIEFIGKPANAGNADDSSKGINALESVMLTWHAINSFRLLLKGEARVFGIITEGGVSPDLIPDRAVTIVQIRVKDKDYFCEVIEKVKNAAHGAALATGARVNIEKFANTYLNMLNNLTLAEIFKKNLVELGMTVEDVSPRSTIGTDMGNVSQIVPSIHPFIAIAPRGTPWHTIQSAEAATSPMAYEATIKAAKAFGMSVIDILTNPELAVSIKNEFDRAKES